MKKRSGAAEAISAKPAPNANAVPKQATADFRPVNPESAPGRSNQNANAALKQATAEIRRVNPESAGKITAKGRIRSKGGSRKIDVTSQEVGDCIVIEPLRRPKNRRARATMAAALALFTLAGSLVFYGGLPGNDIGAASPDYRSVPKTGAGAGNGDPESAGLTMAEPQPVTLKAVSVERDMNVRINDADGYPVAGHHFQLTVTDPDGNEESHTDLDRDGRIYLEDIPGGDYRVSMQPLDGFMTPDPIEVEVPDKVAYQQIEDIEDKISSASEINAAADDPQYGNSGNDTAGTPDSGAVATPPPVTATPPPATPTPTVVADTVEYVESRTETRETVKYTGRLGENGRLYAKNGALTEMIPVVADGYLTGEYSVYTAPPAPSVTPPVPPPSDPALSPSPAATAVSPSPGAELPGIGGSVNLFEKDQQGNYIYDVTPVVVNTVTLYYGWQELEGAKYYFSKDAVKVTGTQVIRGVTYSFDGDGKLSAATPTPTPTPPPVTGTLVGVDVSTWQNHIDWNKVKAAGVSFAMIRIGFRGYGTGKLVEDDLFYTNLAGAKAAGLKVGVYFFTQAVNEKEAVEEASMVVSLMQRYGYGLEYPVAFDSEYSGAAGNTGRADGLSRAQRTACAVAFCETLRNSGYTPMVYASKSWFETNFDVGQFGNYKIWLAHYTPNGETSSYSGRYEMWQYTSRGSVNGIAGNVDLNYGYLGY